MTNNKRILAQDYFSDTFGNYVEEWIWRDTPEAEELRVEIGRPASDK